MSYTHPPRGDVKRLPKWAQEYITNLQNEISNKEDYIAELASEHPGSRVVLDGHAGYPSKTLPDNSRIRFYLGESREGFHDMIEVSHDHNDSTALHVYGAGPLSISPIASNVVTLKIADR